MSRKTPPLAIDLIEWLAFEDGEQIEVKTPSVVIVFDAPPDSPQQNDVRARAARALGVQSFKRGITPSLADLFAALGYKGRVPGALLLSITIWLSYRREVYALHTDPADKLYHELQDWLDEGWLVDPADNAILFEDAS